MELINICCFKDNLSFSNRYLFAILFLCINVLCYLILQFLLLEVGYINIFLPHYVELGHVTCFGLWNAGKNDSMSLTSCLGLKTYCVLVLTFLGASLLYEEELVATALVLIADTPSVWPYTLTGTHINGAVPAKQQTRSLRINFCHFKPLSLGCGNEQLILSL